MITHTLVATVLAAVRIAAGPWNEQIVQLGSYYQTDILFDAKDAPISLRTNAVSCECSLSDALERMFQGTGYRVTLEADNPRGYTIKVAIDTQLLYIWQIPSEDATAALREWGLQSNLPIEASSDLLKDKTFNAVHGIMGIEDSLKQMLAGTGVEYQFGEHGVSLVGYAEIPNTAVITVTASRNLHRKRASRIIRTEILDDCRKCAETDSGEPLGPWCSDQNGVRFMPQVCR